LTTYKSVAEIYEDIDAARARLVSAVEPLTGEQHAFRPSPDRWSVAEIIEHLSITEPRVVRLVGALLDKLEASGARGDDSPFEPVSLTQFAERARTEKYQAPDEIRPKGAPLQDSLARLRDSRAALRALRPRVERVDGTLARFPHPAWGPLDLYQWLAFVGMHERRHLAQIKALGETMNAG
jgi:DinB superfamily